MMGIPLATADCSSVVRNKVFFREMACLGKCPLVVRVGFLLD